MATKTGAYLSSDATKLSTRENVVKNVDKMLVSLLKKGGLEVFGIAMERTAEVFNVNIEGAKNNVRWHGAKSHSPEDATDSFIATVIRGNIPVKGNSAAPAAAAANA